MDYIALAGLAAAWLIGVLATLNALDGLMLTYHYARCHNPKASAIMASWTLFLAGVLVGCIYGFAWIWSKTF